MKKILNLFIMAIAIFTLASCIVDGGNTNSFEINGYPKTTYVLGEQFDWTGFSVKIDDKSYDYITAKAQDVKFPETDPDTSKAGTFTVKVTYKGLNASFQYTVLDSYFANGDGTATAPYQISTVEQFKVALRGNESKTYYTLVNDIDFNGALEDRTAESHVTKNVEINGQGYALRGVNGALGYQLVNSTFKNIDFHFAASNEFTYKKRGAIFEYLVGTVTFENIKTFGNIAFKTTNASIFGQIFVEKEDAKNIAVLKNCNNYASFTNLGAYGAVFTSGVYIPENVKINGNDSNSCWYVLNCKNYGEYIATYVGLINPNYHYFLNVKAYYVLDENTKNFGDLISISASKESVYNKSNLENLSTANLSSLLCAFNEGGATMETVFGQYYMYDAAKGIISIDEVKTSGMKQFSSKEYEQMAVADVKDMSALTYNFSIANTAGKYEFDITKGNENQGQIYKYVISLSGASTKHDKDGIPGLKSAYSTFATIECNSLDAANALELFKPDEIYNYSSWELKHGLKWENDLSESDRLSECLYKVTVGKKHAYIVVPCESNGYATKDDNTISFISIVALDKDGKVIGGTGFEVK